VTYVFSFIPRLSGGDLVLVRESAEDLFSADLVLGQIGWLRRPGVSLSRRELAEGTVRPGGVVVQQVLGQHLSQRALNLHEADDDHRRVLAAITFLKAR
jgi:hypothetical protein